MCAVGHAEVAVVCSRPERVQIVDIDQKNFKWRVESTKVSKIKLLDLVVYTLGKR